MLTKIPFVLLATWAINMSCKPPNPQPPQHERLSLSVPLENSGFVKWGPLIGRVSNCSREIFHQSSLYDPLDILLVGLTIRCLRCWNIDYPGICVPFIAAIQSNIVATRLEQWQAGKPSHVKRRCNRIDFNDIGNMDKADDLPSPRTIFPIRGQYSERSRTYCLWSILCRSSSKLHRLDFRIWWIVPLASE